MSMGVIKPKAIPDHVALLQAGFIERAVLDYFKDPVHEKEFRKWKRERRKREKETFNGSSPDFGNVAHSTLYMAH